MRLSKVMANAFWAGLHLMGANWTLHDLRHTAAYRPPTG
jgi:hypothetical protein